MAVDGGRVGGLEDAANAGLLRNAVAYAAVNLWVRRAQGCLCKRNPYRSSHTARGLSNCGKRLKESLPGNM